jgi:hypothetical protein
MTHPPYRLKIHVYEFIENMSKSQTHILLPSYFPLPHHQSRRYLAGITLREGRYESKEIVRADNI